MDINTAYFAINNPFSDKDSEKKYDFMFKLTLPEYEINRQCRFNVRESETLNNLIDKIASNIGKSIKKYKEEKEKEEIEKKKEEIEKEKENIEAQDDEIKAKEEADIQIEKDNEEKQNIEIQKLIGIKNEEIEKDKVKREKNKAKELVSKLVESQMEKNIEENDTKIQKSIHIKKEEILLDCKMKLGREIVAKEENIVKNVGNISMESRKTQIEEDNDRKEDTEMQIGSKINKKRRKRSNKKKVVAEENVVEEVNRAKNMGNNFKKLEETKIKENNGEKKDTEMQNASQIKKRRKRYNKKKVVTGENVVEEVNRAKDMENNAGEQREIKMEDDNNRKTEDEMLKEITKNKRKILYERKKRRERAKVLEEVNRAKDIENNAKEIEEIKMESEMLKELEIKRRKILNKRKKMNKKTKILEEKNRAKDTKNEAEKLEKLQMEQDNNIKEDTQKQNAFFDIIEKLEQKKGKVAERENKTQDLKNKSKDQEKTNIVQGNKKEEETKMQNNEKSGASVQKIQENKEINKTDDTIYVHKNQVKFLLNGNEINYDTTFDEFKDIEHKIIFQFLDTTYQILINQPKIFNLLLPDSLFINFPLYPSVFDSILVEVKNSKYHWYKSIDKNNWEDIGTSYYYTPNESDIGHYLKLVCTPKFQKKFGEPFETVSENKVEKFLLNCPFEKRHKFTQTKLSGKSFRVVSYNILSDQYIKNHFEYCPKSALNIDYRKQLILQELKGYNADIICLQETDYKTYKNFFRGIMANLDYKSYYDPKLGKPEGLSFYYYAPRFTLIRAQSIIIGKEIEKNSGMSKLWSKIKQNPAAAKKLTEQNTVFKVVVLKSNNKTDAILVIGNVHLYFHPEARHIRILQTAICNFLLEGICHQVQRKFPWDKISIIFCGDFNSEPTSGVYEFLTKGKILENHPEWKKNPEEIVKNMKLIHRNAYASAYGTPKYTNYTEDFKDCLDYVFYETKYLQVKQVVPLLSEEEMAEHTGLPSIVVPSDHLSLVVDFVWN